MAVASVLALLVFSTHLLMHGGIPGNPSRGFNGTRDSQPSHKTSPHYLSRKALQEDERECREVNSLPSEERCEFVRNNEGCSNAESLLPYYDFIYCSTGNAVWGGMIVLVLWWLFLFVGLAVCADDYFCPSLVVISKTLRLSPNVAGVTFLAFGNGAPDFFSAITALSGEDADSELGIGGLFGAGMFVTSVVVGAICLVKPFKASERPFLRDIIFYLSAVYWGFFMLWKEKVYLAEAIGYIVVYVFYVCVVIISGSIYRRQKAKETEKVKAHPLSIKKTVEGEENPAFMASTEYIERTQPTLTQSISVISGDNSICAEINDEDSSISSSDSRFNTSEDNTATSNDSNVLSLRTQESIVSNSSTGALVSDPFQRNGINPNPLGEVTNEKEEENTEEEEELPMWKIFVYGINPINVEEWPDMRFYAKFYEIFKCPLVFVISLTCPVVNYEDEELHNWNKPLNLLHCFVGLPMAWLMIGMIDVKMGALPVWAFLIIVGAGLALLVFFTSENRKKPKYHAVFGYIGFLVSLVWIYVIAGEIVGLLQAFGVVMNISNAILGLTLLAWGNSIGDLIADTVMARQGFSRMGFAACFGAPLFNLTLGFGLGMTIKMVNEGTTESDLMFTPVQMILGIFLMISLVSSFLLITFMKFKVRRAYGGYLLGLYIVFLVVALLTETGVILKGFEHRSYI